MTPVSRRLICGSAVVARRSRASCSPVLRPKAYLPVHWDDFFSPIEAGVAKPYADPTLEALLADAHVALVRPAQYLDRWRLDRNGVHAVPNDARKGALELPR